MLPSILLLTLAIATTSLRSEDGISEAELAAKSEPVRAIPVWSGPLDALRSWGEVSEGLQMATSADSKCAVIHVWIRNALATEIVYNDYYLGYFGCVHIEVKRGEKWIRLERRKDPKRFYAGVGPGERENKSLNSMAIAPPAHQSGLVQERFNIVTDPPESRQPQFAAAKLQGFEFSSLVYRKDLPVPSMPGTTFQVDLADFTWPKEFLMDESQKLRVIQELARPDSLLTGTFLIISPEMKINSDDLKSFLALLAKTPAPNK